MKRILIIDDAATVRMYHRSILEGAGFVVEEAVNGFEGIEKAVQGDFDLYLVDVNMPKLDGYGFLRELRHQDMAQAPAIMVSTEASDADRRRALEAGASYYIVKPLRPAELTGPVALLLGVAGA